MSLLFDCRDDAQLLPGLRQARRSIARGELIVMPTDTVYGIAADAFDADAVQRLLDAKGRTRQSPPPVLVSGVAMLRALTAEVPEEVQQLTEAFWPGGLTIVLPAQPSLSWDIGETYGTVAIRMPDHPVAHEVLEETGPLAVSSANITGKSAAVFIEDAQTMLGESVAVYLDSGPSATGVPSTIIDCTALVSAAVASSQPMGSEQRRVRILREGVITTEQLRAVLGEVLADPDLPSETPASSETASSEKAP